MLRTTMISAAAVAALLSLGAASAQAECTTNTTAGIAKDGSLAPLQQPDGAKGAAAGTAANPATGADASGIAKDGSTMPMANEPGGGNADVATSPQDVQSQQQGQQTAAAGAGQAAGADC